MKTSQEWFEQLENKYPGFVVMDPDGWDRKNYQFSWHKEMISKEEFEKRLLISTIVMPYEMIRDMKDNIGTVTER